MIVIFPTTFRNVDVIVDVIDFSEDDVTHRVTDPVTDATASEVGIETFLVLFPLIHDALCCSGEVWSQALQFLLEIYVKHGNWKSLTGLLISLLSMARTITAGKLAFDQLDFITPGTIQRVSGIQVGDLYALLFWNGSVTSWVLTDGSFVQDCSIAAGSIYLNEVIGATKYYLIRFLPDKTGYWRLVVRHEGMGVEQVRDFDAVAAGPTFSGLNATFTP